MKCTERESLEFKALQDEILENSRKIYQIITGCIALCAALIGYCFSAAHFSIVWARPFALLSPFLILVPAMILIQSNQHSTVRIAAYLKIVFEDRQDEKSLGWQSAMHWCRLEQKSDSGMQQPRSPDLKRWWRLLLYLLPHRGRKLATGPRSKRHFHVGVSSILCGIASTSILGSALAWWWLLHHDRLGSNQHFKWIAGIYLLSVVVALRLFSLAYFEMREGWKNARFVEWEDHWKSWLIRQ